MLKAYLYIVYNEDNRAFVVTIVVWSTVDITIANVVLNNV